MALATSDFLFDGKDRAIESFGVVKTSKWKITPKHLVGGALRSDRAELLLGSTKQKRSSLEAG